MEAMNKKQFLMTEHFKISLFKGKAKQLSAFLDYKKSFKFQIKTLFYSLVSNLIKQPKIVLLFKVLTIYSFMQTKLLSTDYHQQQNDMYKKLPAHKIYMVCVIQKL